MYLIIKASEPISSYVKRLHTEENKMCCSFIFSDIGHRYCTNKKWKDKLYDGGSGTHNIKMPLLQIKVLKWQHFIPGTWQKLFSLIKKTDSKKMPKPQNVVIFYLIKDAAKNKH